MGNVLWIVCRIVVFWDVQFYWYSTIVASMLRCAVLIVREKVNSELAISEVFDGFIMKN